jgi:hypothetical protein
MAFCLVGAGMLMPPAGSVPLDGVRGASHSTALVAAERERSVLRIATSSKSVPGFASVALALTTTPERPDRTVTLWQRAGGGWTKVSTVTVPVVSSQLTWTAPNRTGAYQLRATSSGGADYRPTTSNVIRVKVKAVANAKWIYALDAGTPNLNAGAMLGPSLVSMATDVTATIDAKPWPRSLTVSYGEECGVAGSYTDPDMCGTMVSLYGPAPKAGIKRFRTTFAVTAGSAPVKVSFRTSTNDKTDPVVVTPGTSLAVDMAMTPGGGAEVYIYPAGTPLGGTTVTIGSPQFGS